MLDSLLLLTTPFSPKKSFSRLANSKYRLGVTIFSFVFIFLFTASFFQLSYSTDFFSFDLLFPALKNGYGIVTQLLLISIIIEVLVYRIFGKSPFLGYSLSVCSISYLPLFLTQVAAAFDGTTSTILRVVAFLLFSVLVAKGISILHHLSFKKTIPLVVCSMIIYFALYYALVGIMVSK